MPATKRIMKRRKNKTRKIPSKIKKLINIFKLYPEIFPKGYFRFLQARLEKHLKDKTIVFKNGVVMTWKVYKKIVIKTKKCYYEKGDVKLDQIVNKKAGNGKAKKIFLKFLKKFGHKKIWLEVRSNNKRAIRFYKKNGFKTKCKIKFGKLNGIIMLRKAN